jgi:hypothetical protein
MTVRAAVTAAALAAAVGGGVFSAQATPEFYSAFDVKPGDKLYIALEQRVKIW